MQATIAFVSGYVRQRVNQLALAQPVSYAMQAQLIPSFYLDHIARSHTVSHGKPLRELALRLRPPLFEPGGALSQLGPETQNTLRQQAKELAEIFQRSSTHTAGPKCNTDQMEGDHKAMEEGQSRTALQERGNSVRHNSCLGAREPHIR